MRETSFAWVASDTAVFLWKKIRQKLRVISYRMHCRGDSQGKLRTMNGNSHPIRKLESGPVRMKDQHSTPVVSVAAEMDSGLWTKNQDLSVSYSFLTGYCITAPAITLVLTQSGIYRGLSG